jgi:hypothetical protein
MMFVLSLIQSEINDIWQFVIVIQKPATSVVSQIVALPIKRREPLAKCTCCWNSSSRNYVEASMGCCTQQDEPLVCSTADQAKGASPFKVGGLVEIPTAATQKPATSVVSRMGWCTPRDLPLVCSSADQAKGASSCKVGGLVEIPSHLLR